MHKNAITPMYAGAHMRVRESVTGQQKAHRQVSWSADGLFSFGVLFNFFLYRVHDISV